ncbi:MAG: FAD-binding oxidoreductase [Alphaproteobacteria bacterium]|nr:FAD-binding oxidoreductase [Alphaproteobacteria bacterium]
MYFKFFLSIKLLLSLILLTQNNAFAGNEADKGSETDDCFTSPIKRGLLSEKGCSSQSLSEASGCTTPDGYFSEYGECSSNLPSSLSGGGKSAFRIPQFRSFFSKENLFSPPKVAVVGGGLLGVMTALDLDSMGFEVHLFESSPEVLCGASQTATVLHAGGGEYLHLRTKEHCQETGALLKATYPTLYGNSERPIIFAVDPRSDLKHNDQRVAHQSVKEERRVKRRRKEKGPILTEEAENINSQTGTNSQLDIPLEIVQRSYPNLSNAVISKNDILMKIHERNVILKKCLMHSKIKVLKNFTVQHLSKGEDSLFEKTGNLKDDPVAVSHRGYDQAVVVAWNATAKILEASFSCMPPTISGAEQSLSSEFDDETVGIPDAPHSSQGVATALPPVVCEDRVLALCSIKDVVAADRAAIFTLTGGAMFIPLNEDFAIAYRCCEEASYPKAGEKEISKDDVLRYGQNIVDELKATFGLDKIKLAGAIKKVVVRKADSPLNERIYLPPVITPEGVIVGLAEKATYTRTLALQIAREVLNLSGEALELVPEINLNYWVDEINKLIPDYSCLYTGNPLPDAFIRGKDIQLEMEDVLTEIILFLKSFELTAEVGVPLCEKYEDEKKKCISLLQRARSASQHDALDCPAPGLRRAYSDPYSTEREYTPSLIELAVLNAGKPKDAKKA